ncbi:hypothetical protein H650_01645 [Enterobacter sp. R4-368]|nr:hypothetical protein H650_01645 [Enterobacter sp. R4-368]
MLIYEYLLPAKKVWFFTVLTFPTQIVPTLVGSLAIKG